MGLTTLRSVTPLRAMGFKKKVGRGPRVPDRPKKPTIHDCEDFFTNMIEAEKEARWDLPLADGTPEGIEVNPDGYYYLIPNQLDKDGGFPTIDATDWVRQSTQPDYETRYVMPSSENLRQHITRLGELCRKIRPRAAMCQMMGTSPTENGPLEFLISFMVVFDGVGGVEKVLFDGTEVIRHDSLKSSRFPTLGKFMGWGNSIEAYQWTDNSEEEIISWWPEALSWKDSA